MKYCSNCGVEDKGYRFCRSCGHALTSDAEGSDQNISNNAPSPSRTLNRIATILLWVGLALILLSVLSCTASCALLTDSMVNDPVGSTEQVEDAGSVAGVGLLMFFFGVIAVVGGAVLKALKKIM